MENEKYHTGEEVNNIQNISAMQNSITNTNNLNLKAVNRRNTKNVKSLHSEQLES